MGKAGAPEDEPPNRAEAEHQALAAFCALLPSLRTKAEQGFWTDTLELHVTEVLAGGSALTACEELNLEFGLGPTTRDGVTGAPSGAATDWFPTPTLVGDYRCPLRRCDRRADRDAQGRPPRCGLSGDQMLFVRRDPG